MKFLMGTIYAPEVRVHRGQNLINDLNLEIAINLEAKAVPV